MKKIDTFIVGAPKCGTTSLANYLSTHPDVCLSTPKEPHFFCTDMQNSVINTLEKYHQCFKSKNAKCYIDASTWYLFSETAAKNIYNYNPDAKIIIMLRDPSSMVYSLYLQNLFNGTEIKSFEEALKLEEERKRNKSSANNREHYQRFLYKEAGVYKVQIDRFSKTFPSENIQIILFEDFIKDTRIEYDKVLNFLGLKLDYPSEGFKVHNVYKSNKSQFLKQKLANPPTIVSKIGKILPHKFKYNIGQFLMRMNRVKNSKPKINLETKQSLIEYFNKHNIELRDKYNLDINDWMR